MTRSALVGMPPATDHDYWIAMYMINSFGLHQKNASQGFAVFPPRPVPSKYHFETKRPGIIAGLSVCIFIMVSITGVRLYARLFTKRLKAGLDDGLIVPGVVCFPFEAKNGRLTDVAM